MAERMRYRTDLYRDPAEQEALRTAIDNPGQRQTWRALPERRECWNLARRLRYNAEREDRPLRTLVKPVGQEFVLTFWVPREDEG